MAEWSKAHAWTACVRATIPRVRIPLPRFAVYPNSIKEKAPTKSPPMIMPGLLPFELVLRGRSARRPCHQMPDMDGNQAFFRKNPILTQLPSENGRFSEMENPEIVGGNRESIRIFAGNARNFENL